MSNKIVKDWKSQTDRKREQRFMRSVKTTWILIGVGLGGILLVGLLSEFLSIPDWLFSLSDLAFSIVGAIGLLRFSGVIRDPIDAADAAAVAHEDQMEMRRNPTGKRKKRRKKRL